MDNLETGLDRMIGGSFRYDVLMKLCLNRGVFSFLMVCLLAMLIFWKCFVAMTETTHFEKFCSSRMFFSF